MPASSSARVLTQAPWWSRLGRKTGRSGTTASRSAAVGVPPGKADIAQPPPRIHGRSGCASAYALMMREVVVAGVALGQVAAGALEAALHRVHVRVDEAGREQPAAEVDDLVAAGRRGPLADRDDPAAARPAPRPRRRTGGRRRARRC